MYGCRTFIKHVSAALPLMAVRPASAFAGSPPPDEPLRRSFASQLGKVMGAEIPEPARRLIVGGNLRRLLTPILRAKGYRVA